MKDVNELIREAAKRAYMETDDEPEPKMTGEPSWPVTMDVGRGLEGAIACSTRIGYVNGAKGWLVYRGYNCFDLAERSTFEETSYLLLHGELPTREQLQSFEADLRRYRKVPPEVLQAMRCLPIEKMHPMAALRTAVSILGTLDPEADSTSVEGETKVAVRLIAAMATLTGMIARLRAGKEPIEPDPSLSHAADFLYMMTGEKPDPWTERIMDVALILHADHGMNASTFTSMVTNSSLSDMYSTIVAGICSLKGPLHGGANEQVLLTLREIGKASNVEAWFTKARAEHRRVMGFGHRVYKAYDPRARILGPLASLMAERQPSIRELYETAVKLDEVVRATLGKEKKIFPNVDFYSGLVYEGMGIEPAMYTPIFAVSRVSGWTARVLEYLADNRLFRPRAAYTGALRRPYAGNKER